MNTFERQQILDEEHLRLLRIGYFVMGGVSAFMGVFGVFYALMGVFMLSAFRTIPNRPGQPPPEFMAWIFAAIGILMVVLAAAYAALAFLTARNLRLRRSRTVCLVTAGLSCLYLPFGTLLGVFTFSVLGRPTVLRLFGQASPSEAPPPLPVPPPPPPSIGTVA